MTLNLNKASLIWILAGVLAVAVMFPGLGGIPFTDRDEGEYSTVAWEMTRTSDFVIPQVNGRAYYEKPALFFWLTGLSFEIFGLDEWAGRLTSALSGVALVLLIGWFGQRRGGPVLGILSGLFAATSLMILMLARVALVDMLLTLWTTAAIIGFYEGLRSPVDDGRWFYIGWAALGLAFLTKGPVGVAAPFLALAPLVVADFDFRTVMGRLRPIRGLLVFFIVAGPWYLAALVRDGDRFWEGFFVSQNIRRYTEVLLGHGPPVWYYLPVLALGLFPWCFFGLAAGWSGIRQAGRWKRWAEPVVDFDFFLSLWFLAQLIFFSLSATKLPHYILPATPALLLLAGRWWQDRLTGPGRPAVWTDRTLLVLTATVGLTVSLLFLSADFWVPEVLARAASRINPDSAEYAFAAKPTPLGWTTRLWALGVLVCLGWGVIRGWQARWRQAVVSLGLAGLVLTTGLAQATVPRVLADIQDPARAMAFQVRTMTAPSDHVAAFGLYKPTLWFYTQRRIDRIRTTEPEKLRRTLKSPGRVLVMSRAGLVPELTGYPEFRLLHEFGGYVLGDNQGAGKEEPGS